MNISAMIKMEKKDRASKIEFLSFFNFKVIPWKDSGEINRILLKAEELVAPELTNI